jgi:hypothetical protein
MTFADFEKVTAFVNVRESDAAGPRAKPDDADNSSDRIQPAATGASVS